MSRHLTRQEEIEADRAQLLEEHAALRRIATLVAKEDLPEAVFATVAEETGRLFGGVECTLLRTERDGAATNAGSWGEMILAAFPLGTRFFPEGDGVAATVLRTGNPHRIDDYSAVADPVARSARDRGIESSVGCPIVAHGAIWGAIVLGATEAETFPPETEMRLTQFADLVGTAVANAEARAKILQLADEQAALRRVATLVARELAPVEILVAVTDEAARALKTEAVAMLRFEYDGTATLVAQSQTPWDPPPLGTRFTLEGENVVAAVHRTGQTARMDDWTTATGSVAALAHVLGVTSAVATPIIVEGRPWGTMVAATNQSNPLPADIEARIGDFTELVATAISNATVRAELIESRARIVTAGDEARERIERNLHDGTQQRLIALGLDIQRIRATIPKDQHDAHLGLERAEEDLQSVLEDLRELSRGLHPPLLSRRGLRSALRALTRDSPIPVELEIDLPERPPAALETAVYYVVAESVTNALRHSQASRISVTIETDHAGEPFGVGLDGRSRGVNLHATIADDGVGGADPSAGSGLTGLTDRVEALRGRFALDTPSGGGTRISIELPLETR